MHNEIDFEEAIGDYPPPDDDEAQAEAPKSSQPSLDDLLKVYGMTFNEGQAMYTKRIAGILYEKNLVTILQSEDGKLLPAIDKEIIPQQFGISGHSYPKVILEGIELIVPSCVKDFHKEIVIPDPKTGGIRLLQPMIPLKEAVKCCYGDFVCRIHAYEFKTTKKMVCVDHLADYCEYLEKSVKNSSRRRLSQKFLEIIGLRKPRKYKKSGNQDGNQQLYGQKRGYSRRTH